MSGSLKDAVEVVNESVDNITDAFNNGGINEAVSAAGDEFANLATEAASHAPEMVDLGIFASIDPVALDQASYDAVVNANDPGKAALIERMNSRHGIHTVEAANQLGLGNREYEIVNID